jgi:hypothetical protein
MDILDIGAALIKAKTYTDAEVGALQTDVTTLETTVAALGAKIYGIRWDKTNSACTRFGESRDITSTTTNFKHNGSENASYYNPFDVYYPWSERQLCKVSRTAYAALTTGDDITDAVTAWEDDPTFALDGSGDFTGVYTPEFWAKIWEDGVYVFVAVSDTELDGWQHFEATIGGRYMGSYDSGDDLTSIELAIPKRLVTVSSLHSNAEAQGMTLDDIFTWCADSILLCVEYATLNSETAVGKGCDSLYRQSGEKCGQAADAAATMLKLPNAFVLICVAGAVIGLGTADGGEQTGVTVFVSSTDLDGEDPLFATHKAVTVTPIPNAVTTDTYISIHGCYNAADAAIGSQSGYIGTNGKCNAFYRGRVSHANYYRYVLGAYRQTGTGKIWVANSRVEAAAADALNTGVHRDTGIVLPVSASNYIATMAIDAVLPLLPNALTVGGSGGATNPVGDYQYTPTLATGNTILIAGGRASLGSNGGRFYGNWNNSASDSYWFCGALPFLKTP